MLLNKTTARMVRACPLRPHLPPWLIRWRLLDGRQRCGCAHAHGPGSPCGCILVAAWQHVIACPCCSLPQCKYVATSTYL
jgi:hypothetical protein